MSIIAVLIPVTLVLVACGVWAFFWAVRTGQFEELDVPGWEVLLDERGEARSAEGAGGDAETGAPEDARPAAREPAATIDAAA